MNDDDVPGRASVRAELERAEARANDAAYAVAALFASNANGATSGRGLGEAMQELLRVRALVDAWRAVDAHLDVVEHDRQASFERQRREAEQRERAERARVTPEMRRAKEHEDRRTAHRAALHQKHLSDDNVHRAALREHMAMQLWDRENPEP